MGQISKYSLPEVEPFLPLQTPGLDIATSYDVTNDYGTPNLLFSYYTPFIPDEKKEELATVHDDFQSWNAWELANAEIQLQKQLAKGTLPADDLISSRVLRSMYRAKVIVYLRENSENGWLLTAQSPIPTSFSEEIEQSEVNATIRKILHQHHTPLNEPKQLVVLLNTISNIVAADPTIEHKYQLTNVFYYYDDNLTDFQPVVEVVEFTITQEQETAGKDTVFLKISGLQSKYMIDRKGWADARSAAEDIIQAGEKIRPETSLGFYIV
ncbi:hypothetical protein GGI35DRAFT_444855 [Trichoderma velutinum]